MIKIVDGIEVEMSEDEVAALQALWASSASQQPRMTILAQISNLEAEITPRRMREAVLGVDGGWLASKEAEIQVLRGQL